MSRISQVTRVQLPAADVSGTGVVGYDGPSWLSDLAVHEWHAFPSTSITAFVVASPLYDDIMSSHGATGTYYLSYSGGAFRRANSEIIFGASGGGASAWMGSDIVGLDLSQDSPQWVNRVPSVPPNEIWPAGTPGNTTFTVNVGASTLTVSATKNGFQNDERFSFPVGTPPAPLQTGVSYWIVNASGYAPVTFQVAATQGGAPITLTDSGDAAARVLWVRTSHSHMKSGKPNARHAYNQPQHIAVTDEFVLMGVRNVWETDSGAYPEVSSWQYGTADWDAKDTYPDLWTTSGPQYDAWWTCQDHATGTVYFGCNTQFGKRTSAGTVTKINYSPAVGNHRDKGKAVFDAVRGTILLHVEAGVTNLWQWWELNPTTGAYSVRTMTGPAASSLGTYSAGICQDDSTGAFYIYNDDGYLYKVTWVADDLYAEQLATTGAGPVSGWAAENPGIWNRLWYAPQLGGVVLVVAATKNAYFIRTA